MTAGAETRIDLAGLRSRLAAAPDADRLLPLGLGRVIAGPDALDALPPVLAELLAGRRGTWRCSPTRRRCGAGGRT